MAETGIYSVGDLTRHIKALLENDRILHNVEVAGEVSNLTYHGSGHVYFSIKDRDAQLSCVMFRSYAQYAARMQLGDQMIVKGGLSVYAPRGNYQLMVRSVRKQGVGDLHQRFVELKERLQKEGLFAAERKKPLPFFPDTIAVITSPTGAAVRDILQSIRRRYLRGNVIVIPTTVQGTQGEASIVKSLASAQKTPADVIILARGGGSLEDLWNFNEESVARAIAASEIPVISGVGHETDFTIADFVADMRASTPTAAAETAVPDLSAWLHTLNEYERQLKHGLQSFIDFRRQLLDDYANRLEQACYGFLQKKRHEIQLLETQLLGLDQRSLLQRGYTLTLKDGLIQRGIDKIEPGDEIETIFWEGRLKAKVVDTIEEPKEDS